jgi:hypothetical protein
VNASAHSLRRRSLHLVLALALLSPSSGAFALERSPAKVMQDMHQGMHQDMQGHHEMGASPHDCCPTDDAGLTVCAAFCAAAASATLPSAAPAIQRAAPASFVIDAPEHAPPARSAPPLLRPPSR